MQFTKNFIALAACFLPLIAGAPTPDMKITNVDATDVIADSYIVVYNKDISSSIFETEVASVHTLLSKRGSAHKGIGAKYDLAGFKGYQIETDAATLSKIASSSEVAFVEKDTKVYASTLKTQTGAPWGLGSISHKDEPSTSYIYDSTAGAGTTVYVVDTGIYIEHEQFDGRATWGENFVSGSEDTDENGHGTHCSGTIAGSTYGVAKAASLVAVKVLDADGSGSNSGVISGIEWVATNGASGKSVLSMSLGGSLSAALNSAVEATIAAGVTVVVAAGNDDADASKYSPASVELAITVGASDKTNARASFSNFGKIVDVFAPGVNILSSWIGSKTATNTISGTSMATPHVAGLAAYLIALEGLKTPAAVQARIKKLAGSGLVTDPGTGSPNLLAYNGNGA